ncbi:MAG: 50S ribosomal protein L29 [Planctomycetia bacterium]
MKARDIRRREAGDLEQEVSRLRGEIFQKRFHGHNEDKGDRGVIRRSRRDVARILTVLRERQQAATAGKAR